MPKERYVKYLLVKIVTISFTKVNYSNSVLKNEMRMLIVYSDLLQDDYKVPYKKKKSFNYRNKQILIFRLDPIFLHLNYNFRVTGLMFELLNHF